MDYKNYYFVLDTETSGLWARQEEKNGIQIPRCQITEISIIVLDYNLQEVDRYYSMIKPYNNNIEWNAQAATLTGISKEICEQKGKNIGDVVTELIEFCKKYKNGRWCKPCAVAHNWVFDKDFIEMMFDYAISEGIRNPKGHSYLYDHIDDIGYDTMKMARSKWPEGELSNFKLATVAEKIGIDINVSLHTSMDDTIICSEIFKYMISCMRGVGTVASVQKEKFTFQY